MYPATESSFPTPKRFDKAAMQADGSNSFFSPRCADKIELNFHSDGINALKQRYLCRPNISGHEPPKDFSALSKSPLQKSGVVGRRT